MLRILLAAAFGLAAFPYPAWGAPIACSPRPDVLAQLGTKFQEVPVSAGLANNGGLLELLSTPDGKTWTIIITMPNGVSCLVAAGEDWQDRVPVGNPS
jgi:hypothetical protein